MRATIAGGVDPGLRGLPNGYSYVYGSAEGSVVLTNETACRRCDGQQALSVGAKAAGSARAADARM